MSLYPVSVPLTPNSSEDSWRFELEGRGRKKEEKGFEVSLAAQGPYFPGVSTLILSFQSTDNGD